MDQSTQLNYLFQGYGFASLPDTPITPETLFYTASTTKAFCAAGASLLVDDDEKYKDFQWTTPISRLIRDDFVLQDMYWTEHITIEDALSHRTGMPRHDKCCIGTGGSVRDIVQKIRHLPPSREPRTVAQYCNFMYVAVSHAIEVVTGEYLGDFLAHRI
jgi:CubicO group peptidase (beta-lactamase class C family)